MKMMNDDAIHADIVTHQLKFRIAKLNIQGIEIENREGENETDIPLN